MSFFRSPFIIIIDSLAACIHIHTQPGISALREVLDRRERALWNYARRRQQPEEETGEEGEEEEKVRHGACVFYPHFPCKFESGARDSKTVCALCV